MRKVLMTVTLSVMLVGLTAAQPAAVIVHNFASLPFQTRGNIQIKALVTDEGSIGLAVARPGVTQTGHHHQQEQVVLSLDRPLGYTVAETTHRVEKYSALIPPANVHHFYMTPDGDERRKMGARSRRHRRNQRPHSRRGPEDPFPGMN